MLPIRLGVSRDHRFFQPLCVLPNEVSRRLDDPPAAAEVLLKTDFLDVAVAFAECQDVAHVATTPLVDRLVIITNDADVGAQLSEETNQGFLL